MVIRKSITRLHSIAAIHRQLYDQENLTHIYLNTFFESFKEISGQQYGLELFSLVLTHECHQHVININQAVPCAMLLNELTGNICTATHKGTDTAKLTMAVECHDFQLSVSLELTSDEHYFRIEPKGNSTLLEIIKKQLHTEIFKVSEDRKEISFVFTLKDLRGTSSALPKNYTPNLTLT
jgi:two-component sensor histidine kinase